MSGPLSYLGTPDATTTIKGKVELATVAETTAGLRDDLACTPLGVAAVAIAGAPAASTTQAGIIEIATNAEAAAQALTDRALVPSNLPSIMAAAGAIGGTTPAAGTFTSLTADGTGTVSLGANASSNFTVTGAAADATIQSVGGSVNLAADEAVANAISIQASAGGVDVDGALLVSIASSRNNAQAILLSASAGGIDINAAGAAGEDIDIVNTAGSVNISGGEAAADGVTVVSAGGMDITATAGDLDVTCGGGITIQSTENAADSVAIISTVGGIDITCSGAAAGEDIDITTTSSINLTSTENAALALYLHANGGVSETVKIHADQGTGVASIDVLSDVGGITLTSGLASADAINIVASNAAGGIDIDSGTAGFIVDTTGAISLDAAAASNFTATGAFDVTVSSTAGSINISGGEAAADALNFDAASGGLDVNVALQMNLDSAQVAADAIRILASDAAGGIDVDAGTGGITIDSTGAISIDAAAASNLTTSVGDLSLISSAGSVVITGAEAAVDAVDINASNAAGGIDIDAGTGGITMDTTAAISLDSATASNFTVTGAADLTLNSTAGAVNVTSGETNADSVVITSAGGMDITATGAAGKDIDIVCTSGSMNVTIGENVSDALVINCSGAASGISIDCGTLGVTFGTGIKMAVTSVATAATPYAVLGTDYFITTDSTGGALEITLPAAPATGRTLIVYDGAGQAAAGGNITINGNGKNIAAGGTSAGTKLLNTAYESYTLTYNGTLWCGQNIV